jgi:hypothetical protein
VHVTIAEVRRLLDDCGSWIVHQPKGGYCLRIPKSDTLVAATFDCKPYLAALSRGERVAPPPPNGDKFVCGSKMAPGRILAGGVRLKCS